MNGQRLPERADAQASLRFDFAHKIGRAFSPGPRAAQHNTDPTKESAA